MLRAVLFLTVILSLSLPSHAQTSMDDMPNMPGMAHHHHTQSQSFIDILQAHTVSGTDAEPVSTPAQMLMGAKGQWQFMLHGEAFLNELQQAGPRGGDKFFSTNWLMGMAQ